jgi:hypothetical protein
VTVFGIRQTEPASKLQQRILLPRQWGEMYWKLYEMWAEMWVCVPACACVRVCGIVRNNWWGKPFNLLKTKRNLLYISNQSVPRFKHFPPRL